MKKQLTLIAIAVMVMMVVFYFSRWNTSDESVLLDEYLDQKIEEPNDYVLEEAPERIYYLVDVKGQVKLPGVYEVESTLRVNDVIVLAGGFLETAQVEAINLAQKIKDEMVIYVPHLDEVAPLSFQETWQETKENQKVSLNDATEIELQTLPGIGPSKAAAIVKYREEIGFFQSIEELVNVRGIGAKTLENLRESIEL